MRGLGDRPRVLVLAPSLPIPPMGGGDLRALQTISGLARFARVAAFGLGAGADGPPPGVELWRNSADRSVMDPRTRAAVSLRWLGEPGGHPFSSYVTETVTGELESLCREFRPDVAVVETLTLAGYVETLRAAGARVVLNAHNVEGALNRDILGSLGRTLPGPLSKRLGESVERFERQALSAVDQIWACSEKDVELIRDRYPSAAPARVVANSVDVDSYEVPGEAERRAHSVVFPAMFTYPPNAAAGVWLARELLPLLEQRFADAEVVLAGGQPTQEMIRLAETERAVTVTGAVPDMRPRLAAADAMAVPLFQGGGTRFKVLEAFASGLPVVGTGKAVEGLAVQPDEHFIRAETPLEFADALARLWTSPAERERIVQAARSLVDERYSWEVAGREMEAGLRELTGSA
jgi:glycosyltransferase involved in cell wall biosynthesis